MIDVNQVKNSIREELENKSFDILSKHSKEEVIYQG